MFKKTYNTFFPTPEFLSPISFGLDISDESLKFVKLLPTKNGLILKNYGEKKIPAGIIDSGKIKDSNKMKEILISLKKEQDIKSVRVSLPEEQVYLFKLSLDKKNIENIPNAIELSLEEHIPIPPDQAIFDYEVLSEDEKNIIVQVSAIPRDIIEEYLAIFRDSGISVASFELEAQAIARAIIKEEDKDTYMIIDFGEKRTGISVVSSGVVMFASTIDLGGVSLTSLIEKSFKISFSDAEKMKIKYGLQRNAENKEMFSVLLNGVSVLRDEISKHFLYWHTHKDEIGEDRPAIKKIIFCGGDANLIGLAEYFSVSMRLSVDLGNVWNNILDLQKNTPQIPFYQSLSFGCALGLALRNFQND